MRRAAAALEAYHAGDDDVEEGRAFFAAQFAMTDPTVDHIGSLHRAVLSTDVMVKSPYGVAYLTLLGAHTMEESRWLREFAR